MGSALFIRRLVLNRYVAFIGFLLLHTWAMSLLGGMPPLQQAWKSEIPLLLYVYFYLNLITLPSKRQAFITAAVLVLAYTVFDINFMLLGRPLRIVEIRELPELLKVVPVWSIVLTAVVFVPPLLALLWQVRLAKLTRTVLAAVPIAAVALAVGYAPDYFLHVFARLHRPVTTWSDIQSAADIGRLWMMLHHEAKRQSAIGMIAGYKDNPDFFKSTQDVVSMLNSLEKKRNVHLIVLESFVDPALFTKAAFSVNPSHPEFQKLVGNKGSVSISPVFGGGTAQAEFEVLCGVPALRKLSGVEFDVFTGEETACLPAVLAKGGYHPVATNAYKPDFFNSINAYRGVGFENAYYPKEYARGRETYLSTGDVTGEKYMFDGELLRQNLAFVARWIDAHPGVPLFNYVMTIYGHLHYWINTEKRPLVIDVAGPVEDRHLERTVNQYYYRTRAIAEFINGLGAVDPESLVILISDHVPALHGPDTYRKMGYAGDDENFMYINRVFFFENGRVVRRDPIHHYDIPDVILDYITGGGHCDRHACSFRPPSRKVAEEDDGEAYMTIMAHSMK